MTSEESLGTNHSLFGTGILTAVLRYVGTMSNISVNNSESWCEQTFSALPGMPSGESSHPAFQGVTLCREQLTSAAVMLRGSALGGG